MTDIIVVVIESSRTELDNDDDDVDDVTSSSVLDIDEINKSLSSSSLPALDAVEFLFIKTKKKTYVITCGQEPTS